MGKTKTKSKSSIHVLAFLWLYTTILDLTFADVKPELEIHPKFNVQRKPIGKSLILTCSPTMQTMVTDLMWKSPLHNTIERHATGHNPPAMYTEELSGGSLALMITSLSADMAGRYTCSAKYSESMVLEASVKIETYVAITWTNAPENQYPIVGSNYTVKCEVKADPNPTVDWLRNGDQIRTNDKYVVQTHGLLIRNVQESDDDIYTCRAAVVDTGELMERPIRVEVYSPPVISQLAASLEAVDGQSFAANCTAEGKPKPEISWIKDATQQNVASADRFQVNPQTGLLTITTVTQDDYGTYTCIAKNGAGVTDQKTKLNVLVRPSIYELYNVTGVTKKEIAITCRAKGRPAPAITFRRWGSDEEYLSLQQISNGIDNNNNNSDSNERITLEQHSDDALGESSGTLRIANATRSDDGLYQCLARNIGDTAYKTGHITVEFAPDFSHMANLPPVFTWDERKANLSCLALGIPNATIEWRWHDRALTENSDQHLQILTKGPRSDLIVHPVDGRYYSVYKCVARNKHGVAEHDMQLKLARIPEVVAGATPKQLTATSITFDVRGPRVELGLPITAYAVQYKEWNEPDWSLALNRSWSPDSPYIVENLRPQTMYNFRFAAANQVGIGMWGANLQQSTPNRSAPEEPKILNAPLPYDNGERIVMNNFADRFELQWNVPAHNGEPIDSYQLKYCPGIKISGTWHELENDCRSVDIPKANSYKIEGLAGNTYYRMELRAHNIIGYSSPATITMKTSRGESDSASNNLGTLLYTAGFKSAASSFRHKSKNILINNIRPTTRTTTTRITTTATTTITALTILTAITTATTTTTTCITLFSLTASMLA